MGNWGYDTCKWSFKPYLQPVGAHHEVYLPTFVYV